jgi:hypothetical protein
MTAGSSRRGHRGSWTIGVADFCALKTIRCAWTQLCCHLVSSMTLPAVARQHDMYIGPLVLSTLSVRDARAMFRRQNLVLVSRPHRASRVTMSAHAINWCLPTRCSATRSAPLGMGLPPVHANKVFLSSAHAAPCALRHGFASRETLFVARDDGMRAQGDSHRGGRIMSC